MPEPTLDDVVRWSRELGLRPHTHVVYIGATRFQLAHTQPEKDSGADLADCDVHRWLAGMDNPPNDMIGLYTVERREHDATSESFRSDAQPFTLTRLEVPHA